MTQCQLVRSVARATGENAARIARAGFHVVSARPEPEDPDDWILCVDCDFCGAQVLLCSGGPENLPEIAECQCCEVVFSYANDDVYAARVDNLQPHKQRDFLPAA